MNETDQYKLTNAFEVFQADAASINRKNGFVEQEALIDKLEEFLKDQGQAGGLQFLPLIDIFKNARVGLKLMLVVSELGEALEAVRKNLGADDHIPNHSAEAAEIADAVIRLTNYATDRKLDLVGAIIDKNEYNRNRADHSKEGRALAHGKKF
jgi:NTP pyrophosphatase (non-canonical NTP hydrolase)